MLAHALNRTPKHTKVSSNPLARTRSEGRSIAMSPIRRLSRNPKPSIYTPAYRRERSRRLLGWLLVGVGSVMAFAHVYTHLAQMRIVGYQDLLLGYPMAGMLVLAGFMLVGWAAKPGR